MRLSVDLEIHYLHHLSTNQRADTKLSLKPKLHCQNLQIRTLRLASRITSHQSMIIEPFAERGNPTVIATTSRNIRCGSSPEAHTNMNSYLYVSYLQTLVYFRLHVDLTSTCSRHLRLL
ncbi:hypothetical protein TNCV_3326711 [Trichonephila clavipes]|nr:hypothetical protein TNCV_3326711 [Trichonephila clavipes]